MAWEVQQFTLCEGWVNTWAVEEGGERRPLVYETKGAAEYDLFWFLIEIACEIDRGERDPDNGYDEDEFRIVEIPDPEPALA